MVSGGLEVIERFYRADPRIPDPAPQWAQGADPSGKASAQFGLLWSHVAMHLARGDAGGALGLLDWCLGRLGREPIIARPLGDLHYMLVLGCFFAGRPWYSYYTDLEPVLTAFLDAAAARLEIPEFSTAVRGQLFTTYAAKLAEENADLARLVERYRSSRSYRLGRLLVWPLSWLRPASRG
jgi:hypothetical protein